VESQVLFSPEERERARQWLVETAQEDSRLVAAAAVGSSATGGDSWSDLDLTFAVADGVPVSEVLTDWTGHMASHFDAAVLFDLPHHATIYRVFLLPGALQVDLSFTPAREFGSRGPRFRLLFGEAIDHPIPPPPAPEHLFGLGVHHVVRAHICILRGRLWQAEYWIRAARDEALALACRRRSLEAREGRGYDLLPPDVLNLAANALVRAVTVEDLRRTLAAVITLLLQEAGDIPDAVAPWLRRVLKRLAAPG
jgi:hypothetical protein